MNWPFIFAATFVANAVIAIALPRERRDARLLTAAGALVSAVFYLRHTGAFA